MRKRTFGMSVLLFLISVLLGSAVVFAGSLQGIKVENDTGLTANDFEEYVRPIVVDSLYSTNFGCFQVIPTPGMLKLHWFGGAVPPNNWF